MCVVWVFFVKNVIFQSSEAFSSVPCFFLLCLNFLILFFFFFQAEDGIRDWSVTGVQTCALPIWPVRLHLLMGPVRWIFGLVDAWSHFPPVMQPTTAADVALRASSLFIFALIYLRQIGRASCREIVYLSVVAVFIQEKSATK